MLKSKAPVTCLEYGKRYTLLGPLSRGAAMEVEPLDWEASAVTNPTMTNLALVSTLKSMKERGVNVSRFLARSDSDDRWDQSRSSPGSDGADHALLWSHSSTFRLWSDDG